ncbi:A24 family peptidase, partial [Klebsiella pneumoniae]
MLLSFLLILARIDARTQLLPDRLTLPLLWAGLLFNLNEV